MFGTFDSEGAPLKPFEGAEVHHSCWGFHMGLFFSLVSTRVKESNYLLRPKGSIVSNEFFVLQFEIRNIKTRDTSTTPIFLIWISW